MQVQLLLKTREAPCFFFTESLGETTGDWVHQRVHEDTREGNRYLRRRGRGYGEQKITVNKWLQLTNTPYIVSKSKAALTTRVNNDYLLLLTIRRVRKLQPPVHCNFLFPISPATPPEISVPFASILVHALVYSVSCRFSQALSKEETWRFSGLQ